MSRRVVIRAFAVAAVATGGLAALKALHLADDAVRLVALETPAMASAPSNDDHDAEDSHGGGDHSASETSHDTDNAEEAGAHVDEASARIRPASCPPPTIADRAGLSRSEIRVLQSLSERRRDIDEREAELDTRLTLLEAAEQRLDARVEELRGLRDEVEEMMGRMTEAEAEQNRRLVALYERMEPRAAAPIMENLSNDILLTVVQNMREPNLAAVLAAMQPEQAVRVTTLMAEAQTNMEDFETALAEARDGADAE